VGSGPYPVSSDGTHVWVGNYFDDTVTEINAATGTVVRSPIPVGPPQGDFSISSDGTHVWVANRGISGDGTVTEIDAATGTVVESSIPVGTDPEGVSSDGTHVWVANRGDNTVTEIDAATGAVIGSPIPVGTNPQGISSDGTHVWVANYSDDTVTEIDAATGTVVGSPIPTGVNPYGISSDGTHVWVSNVGSDTVTEIEIPRAPGAPASPVAIAGIRKATVFWTAPSDDGGYPITSYTVTAKPGGRTCTTHTGSVTCNITRLPGGRYTFEVTATNAVGTSVPSVPSIVAVPEASIAAQIRPFAFGSKTLSGRLKAEIYSLALLIKQEVSSGYNTVTLVGYTDPGTSEPASLGFRRAEDVENYLTGQLSELGVHGVTINAAHGGSVAQSQNEGPVRNRRVDATLS
jgi:YVTN family beta-propeller protein